MHEWSLGDYHVAEPSRLHDRTALSGQKILIIDDERIVRSSLAVYFEDLGCQVLEASNGRDGVEVCLRESPDIVFTDLRMPVLDGFGVVEQLTAQVPEIPVVIISGVGNVNEAVQAMHLGGWDYITKPVEDLEIINITSLRVLERARLMRENREYQQRLELLVEERTQQLTESEERFRQLFLQHEDAIVLCAVNTLAIEEINPAGLELFGYDVGRITGASAADLFPEAVWGEICLGLGRLADKAFLFYDLLPAVDHSGASLTVSFKGWRVEIGRRSFYYFSMRNMMEKVLLEQEVKATQARLIHANKMTSLGILLSGMAHEINNPNNFIGVNASVLADIWRDVQPQLKELGEQDGSITLGGLQIEDAVESGARLIDGIARGSARINSVVASLKGFSRTDTSELNDTFDLPRVIQDARTILDHHIQSRTDHFTVTCEDNLPSVRGSQQQIEQVLINLLVNALQALQDRSKSVKVDVSRDRQGPHVLLTVADEGSGMTPEVCERVTEPFFSTRLAEGGTGLGLSISSSIIHDHGGTITFRSEPGCGTTVTVRLPFAKA